MRRGPKMRRMILSAASYSYCANIDIGELVDQLIFMYKDKSRVMDASRGEGIEKEGTLINIVDERLQIAVWIYEDELTPKDRELFKLQ
jgi:hypothetical protein